ncbi:hypothetical protein B1R94_27660 [Mycolicibacterium litorale]|nr:hypothetical protein B1R94_27660 [Mycolicibacterium litorale]
MATACATTVLSACASTVEGTAHLAAGAASKNVTADAFDALLLSPGDAAAAAGTPTLSLDGDSTDPAQAQSLSDASCSGAGWVLLNDVYHGTGYLQVHWGRWSAPKPTYLMVFQGIARYPTSLKANDFLTQSTKKWTECAGKSVSRQFSDGSDVVTLGTPAVQDGMVTTVNLFEGGGGSGCSHSLTVKANVVIEAMACTDTNLTPQRSQAVATAIADRVQL